VNDQARVQRGSGADPDQPGLFVRHPILVTLALLGVIAGPVFVLLLISGVPWPVAALVIPAGAVPGGYAAYRTVKHPGNPGVVVRFFQDATAWMTQW
jgi:uncharacterized membrane protein YdbT with pleckstrin-like domain